MVSHNHCCVSVYLITHLYQSLRNNCYISIVVQIILTSVRSRYLAASFLSRASKRIVRACRSSARATPSRWIASSTRLSIGGTELFFRGLPLFLDPRLEDAQLDEGMVDPVIDLGLKVLTGLFGPHGKLGLKLLRFLFRELGPPPQSLQQVVPLSPGSG